MNTVTAQPAYLVHVNYLAESSRNRSYTFRDADLLTARQNALKKVEQILGTKMPHQVLDVTVELVEIDRTSIDSKPTVISTIFQQRYHRTMFMQGNEDLLVNMEINAVTKKSLPPSLFLTVDLEREDKAFESQKAVWNALGDLTCEYEYYQSYNLSTGLGVMQVDLKEVKVKPYSSFYLLYDALPYAASLVSQYNQHYAEEQETLSFSVHYQLPQ